MDIYKDEGVRENAVERLSKRSLALTFLGLFFIFQGLRVFGSEPSVNSVNGLAVLYEFVPRETRAMLWISLGVITAICAWLKERQWVAVASAIVMPVERVVSYLWSGIHALIPGDPDGSLWSFLDALRWASILCLILVIAGWTEYDKRGIAHD